MRTDITITQIGAVSVDDGRDEYLLLVGKDDDLTPEQAKEYVLEKVYSDGNGAGSYFCHTVLAVQAEYSETTVICTVQHRYDV